MRVSLILSAILILIATSSCEKQEVDQNPQIQSEFMPEQGHNNEAMQGGDEPVPLMALTENFKNNWHETASPEEVELFELAFDDIRASDAQGNIPKIESFVETFQLADNDGNMVELKKLLANGPVVLFWYLGSWNPYCRFTLDAMQRILSKVTARGATMIAISPQNPDSSRATAERFGLGYTLLSDIDNTVATKFGTIYDIPPTMLKEFHKDFQFNSYYKSGLKKFPMTIAFIIDTDMKIRYVFGEGDYRIRAEPREIVDLLDHMALDEK